MIVQNFLPKPGTAMHLSPPCPSDEYLWSIAVARVILPPEIHVQAPPNLSDDFGMLLDAGIDDWGGVSPVTADHVNPERPWPALDRLREVTEAKGFTLAPRLTIYPEYVHDPARWLDAATAFPVMDRSDAEGLGRDDPGAVFPERVEFVRRPDEGADVEIVGDRSTAWYSGADVHPQVLVPGVARASGAVREVLDGVLLGQEPGVDELVTLFGARGPEVAAVAEVADDLRRATVGDVVTWVHNRNINYTNVCTFKCRFCGFSKGPLSLNLRGTPYLLTLEDIQERVAEAAALGATEVCLQGGIHPDFDGDYYIDVCRAVKEAAPDIHVHGFTALEVTEGAKRLGEPLDQYLLRLMDAGLRTLPGTAAEILDDEVRAILCPDKVNTEEWLEAHRIAHSVGLRSNITIMFGSIEQPAVVGEAPGRDPRPAEGDRRVHRVRAAAVRAHGRADLPAAQVSPWPDVPRGRAHARGGPHRVPRPHREHPSVVGQARPRRRGPAAAVGLQRPRRHAHGREHLARRGRSHTVRRWTSRLSGPSSRPSAARSSSAPRSTAASSPSADRSSADAAHHHDSSSLASIERTCSRTHFGHVSTLPRSEVDVDQPSGITSASASTTAPQTTHVTVIGSARYVSG